MFENKNTELLELFQNILMSLAFSIRNTDFGVFDQEKAQAVQVMPMVLSRYLYNQLFTFHTRSAKLLRRQIVSLSHPKLLSQVIQAYGLQTGICISLASTQNTTVSNGIQTSINWFQNLKFLAHFEKRKRAQKISSSN